MTTQSEYLVEQQSRWPLPSTKIILAILVVISAIILATFAIVRHNRLNSSAYDLAIYSQAVWNTSQGRPFASSLEVSNLLGDHVQPIILFLAPLYRLWPDARMLLLVQAVILSLGAIPVYRLAKRTWFQTALPYKPAFSLANRFLPMTFALAYLLYPAIGFMNRYDFHTIVLATPILLFALDALESGRDKIATILVLLALICNEEVGLTIFALGLYLVFVKKRRRLGAGWAITGITWSLFAFFVIIPTFRHATNDVLLRYAWLGDDLPGILRTLVTQPLYVLQNQLGDPLRQQFLIKLLLPLGFLSLLSPKTLAIALPCLAYNLLSATPSQSSIYFHYIAPLIPFVFLAAIQGGIRLQTWLSEHIPPKRASLIVGFCLAAGTLLAWTADNPFTQPVNDPYFAVYTWEQRSDRDAFYDAAALIPARASVATTMAYAPHLASRPIIDLFYHKGVRGDKVYDFLAADYLFLNLTDFRWGENPRIYYAMIETAIGRDGYQAIFFQDDVALLTRLPTEQPKTGVLLKRVIDLQEAGGKYAPTGLGTIDWVASRWRFPQLPVTATSVTIPFAGNITLSGYETHPETNYFAGGPFCITLYWQTSDTIPEDYTVFIHLRDETGYVQAQRDNVPVLGFYPTSQWRTNRAIGDMHCLQIPPTIPAGEYELVAGLYRPATGERLPLKDQTADAAIITTIPIREN